MIIVAIARPNQACCMLCLLACVPTMIEPPNKIASVQTSQQQRRVHNGACRGITPWTSAFWLWLTAGWVSASSFTPAAELDNNDATESVGAEALPAGVVECCIWPHLARDAALPVREHKDQGYSLCRAMTVPWCTVNARAGMLQG